MKLSSSLLIFLISIVFAQNEEIENQSYAPQGHLQYNDPNGYKVSWKVYAPFTTQQIANSVVDTNSEPEVQSHRTPRAEAKAPYYSEKYEKLLKKPFIINKEEHEEQKKPVEQYHYQPYYKIPSHIRKLMEHMYDSRPYVDPAAFVYQFHKESDQKQVNEGSSSTEKETESPYYRDFDSGSTYKQYQSKYYGSPSGKSMKSGNYRYKDNYNKELGRTAENNVPKYQYQYQYQQYKPLVTNNNDNKEETTRQTENFKNPSEIQQLLNLQSQIPYHVIANKIIYKPKSLFIPEVLPADSEEPEPGTYRYKSQVYLYKNEPSNESDTKGKDSNGGFYRRDY